jgi:hypothetical protein
VLLCWRAQIAAPRANITLLALLFLIRSQINRQPITAIKLHLCESAENYFHCVNFLLLCSLASKGYTEFNTHFDVHTVNWAMRASWECYDANASILGLTWRRFLFFPREYDRE